MVAYISRQFVSFGLELEVQPEVQGSNILFSVQVYVVCCRKFSICGKLELYSQCLFPLLNFLEIRNLLLLLANIYTQLNWNCNKRLGADGRCLVPWCTRTCGSYNICLS